eukprot:COSAG06_NODE_167_length_21546_cov_35.001352_33_plen_71_part_00
MVHKRFAVRVWATADDAIRDELEEDAKNSLVAVAGSLPQKRPHVGKTALFRSHFMLKMAPLYQDRLGTNI